MRLPAAYSGFLARHFACVFFRRAAWHSGLLQACCRDLTRGSGWNQWRQMEHGLFRGAGILNHHRHAGTSISAFRSSRLGQFWRAEVGNSWRAPKDTVAFVEGKSGLGRLGLVVATASTIAPGFHGVVVLELANTGTVPLELEPEMPVAQLVLQVMTNPVPEGMLYRGKY